MKEIFYKCHLKSDIVLNASLATEGNMSSLDYIPGSNFLGVVAQSYNEFSNKGLAYDVFHSGKVSFGNAYIAKDNIPSYRLPFSLYTDKVRNSVEKDDVYVIHTLKDNHFEAFKKQEPVVQLKQVRGGYLNTNKDFIKKVEKQFSLKSAYDRKERRSAEGKMFGFESIKAGQSFVFSIIYQDENLEAAVEQELLGDKYIGKSKSAEYGAVCISKLAIKSEDQFVSNEQDNGRIVVYAHSNLCFFNEYGQPTFQPKASDFGIEGGEIDWTKSQVRTYSYSSWNGHRNNEDTQKDCIKAGSVFVFEEGAKIIEQKKQAGYYNAEGFGRIIYNPSFLTNEREDGKWDVKLAIANLKHKKEAPKAPKEEQSTPLGKLLFKKYKQQKCELDIAKKINEILAKNTSFQNVSASQWGMIRQLATQAESFEELDKKLFREEKKEGEKKEGEKKEDEKEKAGFLMHGIASDKYWMAKGGENKTALKNIINEDENQALGTDFVVKLAAELAKNSK